MNELLGRRLLGRRGGGLSQLDRRRMVSWGEAHWLTEWCSPPGGGGDLGKVALLTTGGGHCHRSWRSRTGGDGECAPLTGGGSIGRPAIRGGGARDHRSCVSRTAVLGWGDWGARVRFCACAWGGRMVKGA